MINMIMTIAGALAVAGIVFIYSEIRSVRLLVTDTFARWEMHLFGHNGETGLTGDVRALQRHARRRRFDDLHEESES